MYRGRVDESQLQKRTPQPSAPVPDGTLRASDADRDRVADILRDALAEGRLDAEEHAERLDRVYGAKTVGQLEPLVRDLPAGQATAASASAGVRPAPSEGGENPTLVGILSGAERKGRWRVGSRITAVAVMGGIEIDLTEATFTSPELVVQCTAIMGGISVKVPENVTLRGSVVGVMGGSDVRSQDAEEPGAPVVRLVGFVLMGGVEAKPRRGRKVGDLRKGGAQG